MAATMRALQLRQYMDLFLSKNTRADGRKFNVGRNLDISTNTVETADGSSAVKLGTSSVIAGCKGTVAKIDCNGATLKDLLSIEVRLPTTWDQTKHNHIYLGDSQTTASSLQSKLLECLSRCVDLQSLVIRAQKYCWKIDLEIIFLDYDGNYEDLAFIAATACLLSTRLPEVTIRTSTLDDMCDTVQLEDEIVYSSKKFTRVSLAQVPVNCTLVEVNNNFLLDATSDEESLASGSCSITKLLPSDELISLSKVGGAPMNEQIIEQLTLAASDRCKYSHSCLRKCT